MRASDIQIEVRPEEHYVQTRLIGVVDTGEVVRRLAQTYGALVDPWQYDQLHDLRALINVFTHVRYDWIVRVTRPWMRRLAPILRPVFTWNHEKVMAWGLDGIRRKLSA